MSLFVWGTSVPALALEHWQVPIEKELKTIIVTNLDSHSHMLWLSGPIEKYQEPMELSFEVQAFGSLEIPLNQFPDWAWVHLKSQGPGLFQIQVQTVFEKPFLVRSGPSSKWKGRLHADTVAIIVNPTAIEQHVTLNDGRQFIHDTLPALGKLRLALPEFSPGSMIQIEGDSRISAVFISAEKTQSLMPDTSRKTLQPSENPQSHYFEVTNSTRAQGFVVEISDSRLLTAVKKQLDYPFLFQARILIAKIAPGHGELNRDLSDPRQTPWSWHVSQVLGFAELASQDCDGSPEMLEEILKPWLDSESNICFWNYHIRQEISLADIRRNGFTSSLHKWTPLGPWFLPLSP